MTGFVAGFITAGDLKEARRISGALLEKRLVSCCNMVPGIESLYRWKGRIEGSREALIILKTRKERMEEIIKEVRKLHSYELPDIHFMEIKPGYEDLAEWIKKEVSR